MNTAKLSTDALDLSAEDRAALKAALAQRWSVACRHGRHAMEAGFPDVAKDYRDDADRLMSLAIRLGLGMLP